jgi:hypothetical protein
LLTLEHEMAHGFRLAAAAFAIERSHDPDTTITSVLARLSQAHGEVLLTYDGVNYISVSRKITAKNHFE